MTDREGWQSQDAKAEHHLSGAARQHVHVKIERLHQVCVDRACAHLCGNIPFWPDIQKHLERHAQDAVSHHLFKADAECTGCLGIERSPYPIDAIHEQVDGKEPQPELETIHCGIVKCLAGECPKDLHNFLVAAIFTTKRR